MKKRRLSAFAEALLRNRRPKKFKANADDADAMRAAIELRASQAEDARPRPEFVADLHRQLDRSLSAETPQVISSRFGDSPDAASSKASALQPRP
jgi:hypothetical protein